MDDVNAVRKLSANTKKGNSCKSCNNKCAMPDMIEKKDYDTVNGHRCFTNRYRKNYALD